MTGLKIPHTGWNRILPTCDNILIHGLPSGAYSYFNHGYFCEAATEDTIAYTDYGSPFSSIVGRGRLYGVQFHPEKSQQVGLTILRNFVDSC
jgi:glutamine amidotransferase